MGILYIVPTPIGNLEDITIRGLNVLFSARYIACEDTRKTGQLLKLLRDNFSTNPGESVVQPQLISYYEQNELKRIPEILNILQNDIDVVLVSDAGTPLVSDPGFRLVKSCHENGIKVVSLPGASSVLTALAASGLPTDKFAFLGYPPRKPGHRKTFYESIKRSAEIISSTFIIFEAPHKLLKTLYEMQEIFGDIEVVVARELTKIHEDVCKRTISQHMQDYKKRQPKGEIVILYHI